MVTTKPSFKKIHQRKKSAFIFYADVTKIKKTRVVQALRASLLHLRMHTVAENLRLSFEVQVES